MAYEGEQSSLNFTRIILDAPCFPATDSVNQFVYAGAVSESPQKVKSLTSICRKYKINIKQIIISNTSIAKKFEGESVDDYLLLKANDNFLIISYENPLGTVKLDESADILTQVSSSETSFKISAKYIPFDEVVIQAKLSICFIIFSLIKCL